MNDMIVTVMLALNITLMYSTPLIFAALGGVISEKAGVINLGLEGMMSLGAMVAAAVTFYTKNPWIGLMAGGMAGLLLSALHALASIFFKANQTISGIALNFIGPGLALFLSRLMFNGSTQTATLSGDIKIPKILSFIDGIMQHPILSKLNLDATVIVAFLCAVAMWFVLYKTTWGLRVRAVGEHPAAADTLGVNIYAIRFICVLLSGFLAGVGGGAKSIAIVSQFSPLVISGHGYIALAAVIFGKWKPQGAVAACVLFGFAQALVSLLGGYQVIPAQFLSMIPYIITLAVLILFVGRSVAPKAGGVPYEKGQR